MSGTVIHNGLDGVVAAETRLSMVDGARGELIIAGVRVEELASRMSFEETVALLWRESHHPRAEGSDMRGALVRRRVLAPPTVALLRAAAERRVGSMDALRMAADSIAVENPADDLEAALQLVAKFPTIVAAYARLLRGQEPVAPAEELGHAANYLYMLTGAVPHEELVRGLETYLNTVVDHGLNASTFAARVIASTESDFVSAITGAVGALKGPLHGGAPGPALDMVFAIAEPARAEPYLRAKLYAGERLMGFGHRVYKVRDPRADVLSAAAERMFTRAGDLRLYELARSVERTALRLLAERKPGSNLQTNVEFYTALLLHGLGLEVELFTPTFAISRVAGWTAHCFEQRRARRIIRPQSVYVGAMPA